LKKTGSSELYLQVKAVCVSVEGEEYTPGIKVNRKMILFPTGWDVKGKKTERGSFQQFVAIHLEERKGESSYWLNSPW
jgi:hypothetical protein